MKDRADDDIGWFHMIFSSDSYDIKNYEKMSTLKAVYCPTTRERQLAKPENQREEKLKESIFA